MDKWYAHDHDDMLTSCLLHLWLDQDVNWWKIERESLHWIVNRSNHVEGVPIKPQKLQQESPFLATITAKMASWWWQNKHVLGATKKTNKHVLGDKKTTSKGVEFARYHGGLSAPKTTSLQENAKEIILWPLFVKISRTFYIFVVTTIMHFFVCVKIKSFFG